LGEVLGPGYWRGEEAILQAIGGAMAQTTKDRMLEAGFDHSNKWPDMTPQSLADMLPFTVTLSD
jgi:hypothetical protein